MARCLLRSSRSFLHKLRMHKICRLWDHRILKGMLPPADKEFAR